MALLRRSERLKKELGLFDVYVIATGATLSSGFFLLPGLAAASAGNALPIAYLVAGLFVLPGVMSAAELTTAMPRAGGIYYFLDRSMGPLMGTIGGFGTWIALILKASFALIGVGAYLGLFFPHIQIVPIAAAFAIVFGVVNLISAKKSTQFQVYLVVGLLILLVWFSIKGAFAIETGHFAGILSTESGSITYTAGLVVISYIGLSKVASVSEEVRNPERNLPLGMFLAYGTAIVVYGIGTTIMVGVVGADVLAENGGDLTPVATVAEVLVGRYGQILMTIAAVLAFSSVANAGILSASRYPLAMSRDHLLPRVFRYLTKRRTPTTSVYVTVVIVLAIVVFLDPSKIAKLAGAFQLLMFGLACLAVIVMRESHIESYDPGYRTPLYPWLQIFGLVAPIWLIAQMGWFPVLFSLALVVLGALWYIYYARKRVNRGGAIYHLFERLGRRRSTGLDRELRNILKEKGLRSEDPFEETVARSIVIDLDHARSFDEVVAMVAENIEHRVPGTAREIFDEFQQGTRVGATPVTHGVALPHIRKIGLMQAEIVFVRAKSGVVVPPDEFHDADDEQVVHALFFLISPDEDPGQHLRILAQIAERVDDEDFMESWLAATSDQDLREMMLRDDRFLTFVLDRNEKSRAYIGKSIGQLDIPEGALVALVRRGEDVIVARGNTVLHDGDFLTIIGEPHTIRAIEHALQIEK
ncbi:MAG: amino acid permease [Rhodothermales bacterium]